MDELEVPGMLELTALTAGALETAGVLDALGVLDPLVEDLDPLVEDLDPLVEGLEVLFDFPLGPPLPLCGLEEGFERLGVGVFLTDELLDMERRCRRLVDPTLAEARRD